MKNIFSLAAVVLFISFSLTAQQSFTLSGIVKDSANASPLSGVRIHIVNLENLSEEYALVTNALGQWSYTVQVSGVPQQNSVPFSFSLEQNFPNPFNPSTVIPFSIPRDGEVHVSIHNILGQRIDRRSFSLRAGEYSLQWSSKGAAGTLFYTIEFDGKRLTRKMLQLDGGGEGGIQQISLHHGISISRTKQKITAKQYRITASLFGYESDSVVVPAETSSHINFILNTVHYRAFVIDLHNDILETTVDEDYEFGVRHSYYQSDIPRFRQGGIDAQMISLWVDPDESSPYNRAIQMADTFAARVSRNSTLMTQASTYEEIMNAHAEGKIAGIYGVEGGHTIENDLNKLIALYNLGARYMTITWNNSTAWATSAADAQSATKGLNDFGKQVIRTMDSLGMLIDVSHTGIKTIEDVLAVTKNPIIASHSGVRALRNHTRNLTDDQIRAIAARGGVIGVVFYTSFLSTAAANKVTIDTVIAHIDYIKNLVGVDYIALGADYDGGITAPVGLEDVSKMPNLTLALLRRGYTNEEVRKILGENFMRVFKAVCK